jgi:hypothetical protein
LVLSHFAKQKEIVNCNHTIFQLQRIEEKVIRPTSFGVNFPMDAVDTLAVLIVAFTCDKDNINQFQDGLYNFYLMY